MRRNNKASSLLKQVFSAIVTAVRSKTMAVKSKATAMKTRLIIFWLLRNKSFIMSSISSKLHAITAMEKDGCEIMSLEAANKSATSTEEVTAQQEEIYYVNGSEDYDDMNIPDEACDKSEEDGVMEGELQNEINHMADEFIKRFHRHMKMEKQESFKRYQEMLQRGA